MSNNQNHLITDDLSCTIKNLDEFMSFLCAASEDDDMCDPGLAHAIRLASGASGWIRKHHTRDHCKEKRS